MDEPLDRQQQDIVELVRKFGWAARYVAPTAETPDHERQFFHYTIGLPVTFGLPDFICMGLSHKVGHAVLKNAIDELKQRDQKPFVGMMLHEVLEGHPVRLVGFPYTYWPDYIYGSVWFAKYSGLARAQYDCFQLWWPDKSGRFPDDPDCDTADRVDQTPRLSGES